MGSMNKASQRGLTLVEVLIALAVAGGIVAVVIAGYSRVRNQGHAQGYAQTLEAVVAAVDARYPRNQYTGLTVAQVIATPSFPRSMVSAAGTQIVGPEGGLVTVAPDTVGDWGQVADTAFLLSFSQVSRDVCESMARLVAQRAAWMDVNGVVVMERGVNSGAITTATLRTQCSAAELNTVRVRIDP